MTKSPRKNVPDVGIQLGAACMPSELASDRATAPGRVIEYYQVCSNDDPGLTLAYFTARSNLVPYAFVREKGKTIDFSETIVVYDVKVGIWS